MSHKSLRGCVKATYNAHLDVNNHMPITRPCLPCNWKKLLMNDKIDLFGLLNVIPNSNLPGLRFFCVLYLHYNVAFTIK